MALKPAPYKLPVGFWLVAVVTLLIAGCSNSEPSREQQLKTTIDAIQAAAEDRDLSALMQFVGKDYADAEGRSGKEIRAVAQLQFLRYPSIHTFKIIKSLSLEGDENARVSILAAMAGRPIGDAVALGSMRADMIWFDLGFSYRDGWELTAAKWRPAESHDFLQ